MTVEIIRELGKIIMGCVAMICVTYLIITIIITKE